MKRWLEGLASLAMIAASGVLIVTALQNRPPEPPPAVDYEIGDRFATLSGVDFSAAPRTLVMYVRQGCRFCEASLGFYRRLVDRPERVPVVALSSDPEPILRTYLHQNSLAPDAAISVPHGAVGLRVTPVLLTIDSEGRIEAIWRGQLQTENAEAEVLEATALMRPGSFE